MSGDAYGLVTTVNGKLSASSSGAGASAGGNNVRRSRQPAFLSTSLAGAAKGTGRTVQKKVTKVEINSALDGENVIDFDFNKANRYHQNLCQIGCNNDSSAPIGRSRKMPITFKDPTCDGQVPLVQPNCTTKQFCCLLFWRSKKKCRFLLFDFYIRTTCSLIQRVIAACKWMWASQVGFGR